MSNTATSTIIIGGKTVNLRLTKKNFKQARINHNIDLSTLDMSAPLQSPAIMLSNDPVMLVETCWAFHQEQLEGLGFTEDSFCEAVDETVITELREKFIKACAAFFPLVTTLSTMMQALQPGNPAFQAMQQKIQETTNSRLEQLAQQSVPSMR